MDAIKESITVMADMFNTRMNEFQQDLNKTSSPTTVTTIAADFNSFKNFIHVALSSLQKQVELLTLEVDRMEMSRRRKILLFHGVRENKSEDVGALVTSIVTDDLDLTNFSSSCISSVYRLGRLHEDKPRPIVVKFSTPQVRHNIWVAKSKLKGSGITLSEFLTKTRHDVFMAARQRFGVGKCWTRDGSINIIAPNGLRYRVQCMSDLQGVPVAPAKSPPMVQGNGGVGPKNSENNNKVVVQRCKRITKK